LNYESALKSRKIITQKKESVNTDSSLFIFLLRTCERISKGLQ